MDKLFGSSKPKKVEEVKVDINAPTLGETSQKVSVFKYWPKKDGRERQSYPRQGWWVQRATEWAEEADGSGQRIPAYAAETKGNDGA